jgi:hypothetical protein
MLTSAPSMRTVAIFDEILDDIAYRTKDRGVMHEPVVSQRHGLVGKDLAPFTERLVGREERRS